MNNILKIKKRIKPFKKTLSIEGDKSLSIRWALLASQAEGKSKSYNLLRSEDVISTLDCLKKTGGILHLHGLAPADNHQKLVIDTTNILENLDSNYKVRNVDINKIKSYAPHWDHLVLDIEINEA